MNKILLKQLVEEGFSTREIADKLRKSQSTIRWWLKKFELKTKVKKYNLGGKGSRANGEVCCIKCGEVDTDKFYKRKNRPSSRCKRCHNASQIERYKKNKRLAIDYKGGKCSRCGYCKCQAGLDFHHEGDKDPNWKRMRAWNFEKIRKELDKCSLVCRNCHAEIHYGA